MHSDELLFLCELIQVQPDREKKNVLLEEVLNLLVEAQGVLSHQPTRRVAWREVPDPRA